MKQNKKVLITQSNYIPWKGYFDAINLVDTVILYDEMQYTKRDWRNRNKIKTANGLQWLTIPVRVKGKYFQKINETEVVDQKWREKHWSSIMLNYKKATYFKDYASYFEDLYMNDHATFLSEINYLFIRKINGILGINTPIYWSREFEIKGDKTEKLLNLCIDVNATDYYSGPAAKNYLDTDLFEAEGIRVNWLDYSNYPIYTQLYDDFEHGVSIIDLIFNEGPNAKQYMKYVTS